MNDPEVKTTIFSEHFVSIFIAYHLSVSVGLDRGRGQDPV